MGQPTGRHGVWRCCWRAAAGALPLARHLDRVAPRRAEIVSACYSIRRKSMDPSRIKPRTWLTSTNASTTQRRFARRSRSESWDRRVRCSRKLWHSIASKSFAMRGCLGRRAALARARALTGREGVCALVHQAGMLRHRNWAQESMATSCVRVATGMSREHHRGPRVLAATGRALSGRSGDGQDNGGGAGHRQGHGHGHLHGVGMGRGSCNGARGDGDIEGRDAGQGHGRGTGMGRRSCTGARGDGRRGGRGGGHGERAPYRRAARCICT